MPRKNEDIVFRLGRMLGDTTVTGDVAVSTSGISPIMVKRVGNVDKGCPDGFAWDEEKQVCVPTRKLKESKAAMKEFIADPLYKAVLTAKSKKELDKALDTLKSIRGPNAVKLVRQLSKKYKKDLAKMIKDSTTIFGTYGNDNTSIAGSGQTRVVGDKENEIDALKREPRPLKFNDLLGIYLPGEEDVDIEPEDEEPVEESN